MAEGIAQLLTLLVGGIIYLYKAQQAKQAAAAPERRREDIDRTLAAGNAVGIGQLLSRMFDKSKDRNNHSSSE